ncbi:MAG TPA: LLM class flavin-dependent oxidoreductase [Candidatus Limnocylindrales bacterium]|nr:LLM class flavin-dependent oxidoreductase [Candidatus Limnocylindrales bacterium]
MRALSRRVGLGLAARGDVSEVIDWTRRARDAGLDSTWIHDSYYERDAITYGAAIAGALANDSESSFRLALGAVNPYTRHPVVLAMTGSALDEILPEHIVMGIGTGLPLRLKQMGIPYSPDEAVARVSSTIDQLRALWAGERLPSGTPGLPPIQPMFPPVHRIPLFVAAYRKEFVELAGQKADGYLARPCESVPSLRGILDRLAASATAAGRDPGDIETAAYLLSLVDKTRREALNRAKREPFVTYMMSILGDVSMHRAGFDVDLRDKIAVAWRAEDYHEAGKLIPDDLLDAFMLCGTREDVAARAMDFHSETGLDLPLLQPVVQDETQTLELIEAARLYAALPMPAAARESVATGVAAAVGREGARDGSGASETLTDTGGHRVGLAGDRRLGFLDRARRRLGAAYEVLRPFAYTASAIPVLAGGALAAVDSRFWWPPFLAALAGGMLLHSGTNVINEVYDVRKGIDSITSPRMSHAVLKGRVSERGAYAFAMALFVAAIAVGGYLVWLRGAAIVGLGLLGLVAGYTYTAPPFQYKYRALGVPVVFVLMGPIMVVGSYYAVTGLWDWHALVLSLPVGLLVAAILHGNEWRDISEDTRAGISTLSSRLGRDWAHYSYLGLVIGAYLTLGFAIAMRWLPATTVIAVFSLPFLAQVVRSAELGATGQARAIAMIDLQTARLHFAFGALLVVGLLLARLVPG